MCAHAEGSLVNVQHQMCFATQNIVDHKGLVPALTKIRFAFS